MILGNNHYYLRNIELKDLSWLKKLRNDESTWQYLHQFVLLNETRQKKWFEEVLKRTDIEYLAFCQKKHKENILGVVKLNQIDKTNRSVCVGGDILLDYRGKGHAKFMYQLIFKLVFGLWNMHRAWLEVLENNQRAVHIYKKVGFKVEGTHKEAVLRYGQYLNSITMAILENEYLQSISKQTPV